MTMAQCECLAKCPFFADRMSMMPAVANLVKSRLCQNTESDRSECARHVVFVALGPGNVPPDLFPDDLERARELIKTKPG